MPGVPYRAGDDWTDDAAPYVKHTHVTADGREVFAAEDITDHRPGDRIGRFNGREKQGEKPQRRHRVAEDRQQHRRAGAEQNQ